MYNTRIRSTLRPHQNGAKGLRKQYGDRLVCVRYRYDTRGKKRYKTVELIVAERNWTPPKRPSSPNRMVAVRIPSSEAALRRQVKDAGGQWDARQRAWKLRYGRAVALGLSKRIIRAHSL
jgi:hypothetical protein